MSIRSIVPTARSGSTGKVVSAREAVRLIRVGNTVAIGGFFQIGLALEVIHELGALFEATDEEPAAFGKPRALTLVFCVSPGDWASGGANRLARPGLVKRIIGGHWSGVPMLYQLVAGNQAEGYNMPLGPMSHLYRDIAAGKPGHLSRVGLGTFADPRFGGGKLNEMTTEDLVELTDPGALALLIYTSGTTGRPKGVMLDHANISATAELIVGWFEMTADTRSLLVLPLFHVNGIMVSVVSPLLAGGSTFIAERFHAASFWATVEQVRPTFFSAVPTIYALLASRPGAPPDTRSLRFVICGAAPMPRQLIGEFEERFGIPVVEGYGLSECTVACTLNPLHGTRKAAASALPVPGIDVGVADETDQLLSAGQPGEVVVRGPNVMRGYFGRPEESAQVLRGGWLHTGDVGRFDDDGYLTLVDRVKDLIIRGGENIYPKEIEDVLYTHPTVLEAAVVGQPDPVFGEQPVAFVTLRPGFDVVPEDLIEHCRQSLARYKVPREVYIEETLPKNPVGKIAKPVLRERLRDAGSPISESGSSK